MENPKFRIKPSINNQFYFVLRARNGEIVLAASENYTTKQSCKVGIASVKENAPYNDRYEKKNTSSNYSFLLKASNGKVLGKSETY
ncbi:YegP family protein [Chryseolinea lacunae]|uniref:YegP family protein n=1 Tax=Chryseolinea lacunae TaxID=2801331 RepID=A0ABS1KU86_9BACT|nr:YegP family protein [Chryseolinea lacunae]MBL0743043.1 YegP family protein [Chryseolinea lacunae]